VREHQCPSFLEYGEYPFVSADEIKKALKLKATFSSMLDQMQWLWSAGRTRPIARMTIFRNCFACTTASAALPDAAEPIAAMR
jgi:hypothetical protein